MLLKLRLSSSGRNHQPRFDLANYHSCFMVKTDFIRRSINTGSMRKLGALMLQKKIIEYYSRAYQTNTPGAGMPGWLGKSSVRRKVHAPSEASLGRRDGRECKFRITHTQKMPHLLRGKQHVFEGAEITWHTTVGRVKLGQPILGDARVHLKKRIRSQQDGKKTQHGTECCCVDLPAVQCRSLPHGCPHVQEPSAQKWSHAMLSAAFS